MPTLTNNFTNPVILDDDRDPYVSWQHHRERGSQGGVDLAYPHGTPVLAIADGTCETVPNYGTGGNTLRLRLDDGSYVEYMHLDSFARGTGDWVSVGDVIGYSGNTGGDYAPHLHVHVYVNGVRCNVWDYFTGSNSDQAAPSTSSSVGEVLWSGDDWSYVDPKGEVAARIQAAASVLGFYNRDDGSARPADGDFAEFSRMAVQRILADSGTFVGDIDGEIWRGGCYGIQDFATALGNYAGRGGVRDGAPRLLSWTCFADALDAYVASKQAPAVSVTPEPAPVVVEPAPVVESAAEPIAVEPTPEPVVEPVAEPEPTPAPAVEPATPQPATPETFRHINLGDVMTQPVDLTESEQSEMLSTAKTISSFNLGAVIPSIKGRKIAYATFGVLGLAVGNTAVAFSAAQLPMPVWLVMALAVVGNLSPVFSTLAIANVTKK